MSTGAVIGIVIAVIVVVAVVVVASAEMRRARLRRQFGPEYDRLVDKLGSRRKADAELAERERRVRALNIRELSPEQQASYSGDWAAIQERFVDAPAESVGAAHTLIWNVMRDRGYPADDRTASMDALSVHHSRAMEGYRKTADMQTESASTEQLREAMIRYRALFEDLTGLREGPGGSTQDRVAAIRDRAADRDAVAGDGTRTAEAAEPVTEAPGTSGRVSRDPVAEESAPGDRDLAARNDGLAAERADRTADTPR
jgi:Tfp pilus assembly protein PilX